MSVWVIVSAVLLMICIALAIAAYKLDKMVEEYEDKEYNRWKAERDNISVPDVNWPVQDPEWEDYRL